MPYAFTEEEKRQLREQYVANINKINSYLPEHLRFKLDLPAFNKKINDPREAWLYKKSLEVKANEVKKKDIQEALGNKYRHLRVPGKCYELDRVMHTMLIPSDDPEAMAYNDEIMKQYTLHPEAMMQYRFQKVLNADLSEVTEMAKCKDIESLMVLYTEKDPTLVEDSSSMKACFAHTKTLLTPEMLRYYDPVCGNFENLVDASNGLKKVNKGYFTVPHEYESEEQDFAMNGPQLSNEEPELYNQLTENVASFQGKDTLVAQFKQYFSSLPKYGVDVKKPGALSSVVLLPTQNATQPAAISTIVNNPTWVNNPTLVTLNQTDVEGIKKIFATDYTKEPGFKIPPFPEKFKKPAWQASRDELVFKYAIKHDLPVHEIDNGGLYRIASEIAGGVKERLFNTTSLEYKHLIQALKDFDNPNHVAYKNSMPCKIAANQYLIHKGVTTREQAMRLPSPAKDRAILSFDIIETFQKNEGPEIEKLVPGTNQRIEVQRPIQRVQAILNPLEVEENDLDDVHNHSADEAHIEAHNDLEKDDIEVSNE